MNNSNDKDPMICDWAEIPMNREAVRQIVEAFIGQPYLIRELQAINVSYIPNNPISKFIQSYNNGVVRSILSFDKEVGDDLKAGRVHSTETTDPARAEAHAREAPNRIPGSEGENK